MKAKLHFLSKARTLHSLSSMLSCAAIKPVYLFKVSRWLEHRKKVLQEINNFFSSNKLIVRSSAISEDSTKQSFAGAFLSVANVDKTNESSLADAIDQVIKSYDKDEPSNEVFIQELLTDIKMCGVIFTRDMDTFAPYYVVNYDESGSFDSVTSGTSCKLKTYIRFKGSPHKINTSDLTSIITAANELEQLFDNDALDIEFAIENSGQLYILQVRPIVNTGKVEPMDKALLGNYLHKIYNKAKKLNSSHPGLCGEKGMYSVMTDWNPAEIIGRRPRSLALSLYKELITDYTWAYQRDNYGYKNLRSYPLLISFLGQPYIDVRVSFNSFVPKALDEELSNKLVDYYIDRLSEYPSDHDKVEFNTIYSCYYLNLADKIEHLLDFGFNRLAIDRIKYSLLDLTNNIISQKHGLYRKDLEKINYLSLRYCEVLASDMSLIDEIYWLIQDAKRYGTLPFAGLARAGFIAIQFLRSFVELEIITETESQSFMNSLNTVTNQLSTDFQLFRNNQLNKEALLTKYGHLRPGTYDILSPSYREGFDKYFGQSNSHSELSSTQSFSFTARQKSNISKTLIENGLNLTADDLVCFIREAIEGREFAKFVFTRNLSKVLVLIEQLGKRHSISRESMSFVDIRTIVDLYASLSHENVSDILQRDITKNRESYEVSKVIKLPQLLKNERDVYDFFMSEVEPNFIGRAKVTESIITEENFDKSDLTNKIAFIPSADPGYDWIFTRAIVGLVTKYGGANSHMAIRCAELGIPAVIGCGEQQYYVWSKANVLEIDCANKRVAIVS